MRETNSSNKKHLQASTLVEAVVAMVLLMTCIGIAAMVYLNVMESDNSMQKLRARFILEKTAAEVKEQRNWIDEGIDAGSFRIVKTVTRSAHSDEVSILLLRARDENGKTIAERKELIILP